jgi:putative spermidine/putrescine transport system substrate-binding protein
LLLAGCAQQSPSDTSSETKAANELTVVSWGGNYTHSQVKAHHEPFTKKTGIKVESVTYNGDIEQIAAQVRSRNVEWDVVDMEPASVIRACTEGWLEQIDFSSLSPALDGTPAIDDFLVSSLIPCSVPNIVWSTVLWYDADKFPWDKPTTLVDFFDTERYPGKRGLRNIPMVNLEWALMADGVPREKVYEVLSTEVGRDRAFEKLDTIKSSIVWWESGTRAVQMLANDEVVMASALSGRVFNAIVKEKWPFVVIWDGHVWSFDTYAIVKGTRNLKGALEFVQFSTDAERLADQTKWIAYGPTRKSSRPLVWYHIETGVDIKPYLPTTEANMRTALQLNIEFWSENGDALRERFTNWRSR